MCLAFSSLNVDDTYITRATWCAARAQVRSVVAWSPPLTDYIHLGLPSFWYWWYTRLRARIVLQHGRLQLVSLQAIADRLLNLTKGLNEVDVCRCGECNQRWWCSYMKSISPPLCCECFPVGTGPDRRNINGESFIYGPPTDRWDRMERLLLEMVDLLARLKEIYGSGAFLV